MITYIYGSTRMYLYHTAYKIYSWSIQGSFLHVCCHPYFIGELDIGNATMDEKDEELERLHRAINEKQDELSYTG